MKIEFFETPSQSKFIDTPEQRELLTEKLNQRAMLSDSEIEFLCNLLVVNIPFKKIKKGAPNKFDRDRKLTHDYEMMKAAGMPEEEIFDALAKKYCLHIGKDNLRSLYRALKRGRPQLARIKEFQRIRSARIKIKKGKTDNN